MGEVALPHEILDWIETVTGRRVLLSDRRPGGARKEAWHVDVEGSGRQPVELFLRFDRGAPTETDPWTVHREAIVYLALQDSDVLVPRVVAVHPVHQAMLSERVVGENWFARITDPAEQLSTAQHFMEQLATLHRLDPATLDLPGFPPPAAVPDLVRQELDELERVLDARGGDPGPALRFTLDWLRQHVPAYDGPAVLVQGDTGPGNFMYRDGRVVAVVDWELAHLGDPMDDIAWLSLRATQEPFTDFPARLREYEGLTGTQIDDDRVRYHRVKAEAKLQVLTHRPDRPGATASTEGGGGDVGNGLIYGMLHRRLWLEALADAVGIERSPAEAAPDAAPSDHAWLYDVLLTQLRDVVVPRITDPLALQRSKGFARVIKYLAEVDAHGDFYDATELDDLTRMLGTRPASLGAGRATVAEAVKAGDITDRDFLSYLWRRVARETELMRPAMGALADRHWPPLR